MLYVVSLFSVQIKHSWIKCLIFKQSLADENRAGLVKSDLCPTLEHQWKWKTRTHCSSHLFHRKRTCHLKLVIRKALSLNSCCSWNRQINYHLVTCSICTGKMSGKIINLPAQCVVRSVLLALSASGQTRLVSDRPSAPCQDIWTDLQSELINFEILPYCLRYYD